MGIVFALEVSEDILSQKYVLAKLSVVRNDNTEITIIAEGKFSSSKTSEFGREKPYLLQLVILEKNIPKIGNRLLGKNDLRSSEIHIIEIRLVEPNETQKKFKISS